MGFIQGWTRRSGVFRILSRAQIWGLAMELQVEKVDNVTVVTVKAEFLDAGNTRDFKERMNALLPTVKYLLIDLNQVQFIDSSGLAALLTCLKQLSVSGGDLKICSITSPVRALFELVKMQRIVEVCKTRDDALKAFAKGTSGV
jgi:anti-sigma B factor antagonist